MLSYQAKLVKKINLTSNVIQLFFELENPKEIIFLPGQYLIVTIENTTRLYSIASSSNNIHSFELVIQLVPSGIASTFFARIAVGDTIECKGPAGLFTIKKEDDNMFFLATGTGIAPIRSILAFLFQKIHNASSYSQKLILLWGLRTYHDVYFLEELYNYAQKYANFDFVICLSKENDVSGIEKKYYEHFFLGHVDKKLDEMTFPHLDFDYYICGGRDVVTSLREKLKEKNVKKECVFFEKF